MAPPGPPPPPPPAVTPREAAAAAFVAGDGTVTCPLHPWATFAPELGRYTTYPGKTPTASWNLSMKCKIHRYGCAAVKTTWRADREMMLRWLFSAELPAPGATKAELLAMQDAHKKKWPPAP